VIQKVVRLNGLGTFDTLSDRAIELSKMVTIYAENGRGKSTLAAIIRAATVDDTNAIASRRTFLSDREPDIHFRWSDGDVRFSDGEWRSTIEVETLVFDSDFINKNVFVGDRVEPTQRERLLEFALGAHGVDLKRQIDNLTGEISDLSRTINSSKQELTQVARPMPLEEFLRTEPPPTLDSEIEVAKTRLSQASRAEEIRARPLPVAVSSPMWEGDLANVLAASVDTIDDIAADLVQARIARYGEGAESWLQLGMEFVDGDDCPLCSQSVSSVTDLFAAYRGYFGAEYKALLASIEETRRDLVRSMGPLARERFVMDLQAATNALQQWSNDVPQARVVAPDVRESGAVLARYESACVAALSEKLRMPLEPLVPSDEVVAAESSLAELVSRLAEFNLEVVRANAAIESFLQALGASSVSEAEAELERLRALSRRREAEVVLLCETLENLQTEKTAKDSSKNRLRHELEAYAQETLATYANRINTLLEEFGATVRIRNVQPAFRRGTPRTEYVLSVGDQPVSLNSENGLDAQFSYALSEGDKRSLALAFFLARASESATIDNTVVVIDDPVNSLDMHRRRKTIARLKQMASDCGQMILLSHDAFFVRDFQRQLGSHDVSSLSIVRRGAGSNLIPIDIEVECLEEHVRIYSALCAFAEGVFTGDRRDVPNSIRKYLEHCLRSRFPTELAHRNSLGKMIEAIRESSENSPLRAATVMTDYLSEVNDFTSPFSHLTDDFMPPSDEELLRYVRSALMFGRGLPAD